MHNIYQGLSQLKLIVYPAILPTNLKQPPSTQHRNPTATTLIQISNPLYLDVKYCCTNTDIKPLLHIQTLDPLYTLRYWTPSRNTNIGPPLLFQILNPLFTYRYCTPSTLTNIKPSLLLQILNPLYTKVLQILNSLNTFR